MPCSDCSASHGVNPILKKSTYLLVLIVLMKLYLNLKVHSPYIACFNLIVLNSSPSWYWVNSRCFFNSPMSPEICSNIHWWLEVQIGSISFEWILGFPSIDQCHQKFCSTIHWWLEFVCLQGDGCTFTVLCGSFSCP